VVDKRRHNSHNSDNGSDDGGNGICPSWDMARGPMLEGKGKEQWDSELVHERLLDAGLESESRVR
jgi:hypothetical protein